MKTLEDCWLVIRSKDLAYVNSESAHIDSYLDLLEEKEQVMRVVGKEWVANLAVSRLQCHLANVCRCGIYLEPRSVSISHEIKYGFIACISENKNPNTWVNHYVCECNDCGRQWYAEENLSGIIPLTSWSDGPL